MDTKALENEINLLHTQICPALGDPKRMLILYLLDQADKTVTELTQALGVPQSTTSRHLRVLRERGLVRTARAGTTITYSLADPSLLKAIDILRGVLCNRLSENINQAESILNP